MQSEAENIELKENIENGKFTTSRFKTSQKEDKQLVRSEDVHFLCNINE